MGGGAGAAGVAAVVVHLVGGESDGGGGFDLNATGECVVELEGFLGGGEVVH